MCLSWFLRIIFQKYHLSFLLISVSPMKFPNRKDSHPSCYYYYISQWLWTCSTCLVQWIHVAQIAMKWTQTDSSPELRFLKKMQKIQFELNVSDSTVYLLNYDSIHSSFPVGFLCACFNRPTSDVQFAFELLTLFKSAWKVKYFIGITKQSSSISSVISVLCYVLLRNSNTMNHNILLLFNWTMLSQFQSKK